MSKKSIKYATTAALLIIIGVAVNCYRHRYDKYEQTDTEKQAALSKAQKQGKTLVAYFTWPTADDTDGTTSASRITTNGTLMGNTQYVATLIAQSQNADLHKIETERTYPANVQDLLPAANDEHQRGEHPRLKTHISNITDYDIIFVGYPLWCYDLPMALYSFFDEYDLSGKTIVLFTSHGGNRFCKTLKTVQELEPDATVVQGPAIFEKELKSAQQQISDWKKESGF